MYVCIYVCIYVCMLEIWHLTENVDLIHDLYVSAVCSNLSFLLCLKQNATGKLTRPTIGSFYCFHEHITSTLYWRTETAWSHKWAPKFDDLTESSGDLLSMGASNNNAIGKVLRGVLGTYPEDMHGTLSRSIAPCIFDFNIHIPVIYIHTCIGYDNTHL